MPLNKGKHIVAEVDGVRCTMVETGITRERAEFLKDILENNGYQVMIQENAPETEGTVATYTIGVTDLVFNPVIAVYQKSLRTREGKRFTPALWNQWDEPQDIPYWLVGRI